MQAYLGMDDAIDVLLAEKRRTQHENGYQLDHDKSKTAGDFASFIEFKLSEFHRLYYSHDPVEMAKAPDQLMKIGVLVLSFMASRQVDRV